MDELLALASILTPPNASLFFGKGDAADPRMGERTPAPVAMPDAWDSREAAGAALIGVPQDIGVARNGGRIGAAAAPDTIRAALYRLTPFDIAANRSVPAGFLVDLGDVRCDGELEEIHDRLAAAVRVACAAGLVPIVLGGGHDITYAGATGVADVFGQLGIVNLDAHLDVRPPNPMRNSGTSFRMLIEEGAVAPLNMVEFGIQSFANAESHARWLTSRGGRIVTLEEIRTRGFAAALGTAYVMAGSGARRVYATLDIDGVCAGGAPGVSAAMPDGLSPAELLAAARLFGRRSATAALDIVEVNPAYDRDGITAKLAAHAIMHFLGGMLERGA